MLISGMRSAAARSFGLNVKSTKTIALDFHEPIRHSAPTSNVADSASGSSTAKISRDDSGGMAHSRQNTNWGRERWFSAKRPKLKNHAILGHWPSKNTTLASRGRGSQ